MLHQSFANHMPYEPSRAELVQRINALEGLALRRSLMMTAASHDLRQPLQTILAALERVGVPQSERGAEFWRAAAMEQVTRLSRGLADLMLASNDEHSFLDGEHRPVAMNAIFNQLESDWSLAADTKHLYLRFVPSSAIVMSDPTVLRTILTNLVGNAIKYTSEGGIVVGCRRIDGQIAIDVVDTGCGIDADLHQRMFDAFAQGRPCNEGFGIGLWLVKRLSRVSGHELQVWSKPGAGSRFRVTVPISPIATN